MILVDTSVWIDHLRSSEPALVRLLASGSVLCHPYVLGELAMGNLSSRTEFLSLLGNLPRASLASDAEVLHMVEMEQLYGAGIGFVDAHLLASVRLTPHSTLWTRDKRLRAVLSAHP